MYLRCFTGTIPKEWVKWLSWVEFCYNTSFHLATKHTAFEVVYGRPPPSLLSNIPRTTGIATVDEALISRDKVLKDFCHANGFIFDCMGIANTQLQKN